MKQIIYQGYTPNEPIAVVGKECLDTLVKSGDIKWYEPERKYISQRENIHEILFQTEIEIQQEIDELLWLLNDYNSSIDRANTRILLAKDNEDIQRNVKLISTLTQQVQEAIVRIKNLNK